MTVSLPSDRNISSITLPPSDADQAFFAITLVPAVPSNSPVISVENVRSTTKWLNEGATGDNRIQIIEVDIVFPSRLVSRAEVSRNRLP